MNSHSPFLLKFLSSFCLRTACFFLSALSFALCLSLFSLCKSYSSLLSSANSVLDLRSQFQIVTQCEPLVYITRNRMTWNYVLKVSGMAIITEMDPQDIWTIKVILDQHTCPMSVWEIQYFQLCSKHLHINHK